MVICTYPGLIAAYHVLHRLHEPRHPPCALYYFLYDIRSHLCNQGLRHEPEPLILSAVLIVKYSFCVLLRFRSIPLKLKLKSYFLQFVLCQYVKDLLDLFVRGEIPESNRDYNRFSFNLYIKQFRVQEARVQNKPASFFLLMSCFLCFRHLIAVSPERRCSSRTFRYGYLVTT